MRRGPTTRSAGRLVGGRWLAILTVPVSVLGNDLSSRFIAAESLALTGTTFPLLAEKATHLSTRANKVAGNIRLRRDYLAGPTTEPRLV